MSAVEPYRVMRQADDPFPLLQVRAALAMFGEYDYDYSFLKAPHLLAWLTHLNIVCHEHEQPKLWCARWKRLTAYGSLGTFVPYHSHTGDKLINHLVKHPLKESELKTLASGDWMSMKHLEKRQLAASTTCETSLEKYASYISLHVVSQELDLGG